MKVLYDHQIFDSQKIGGISRYFSELMKFNPDADLSINFTDNIYLQDKYFQKYNIRCNYFDRFFFNLKFKGKKRLFNFYYKVSHKDNKSISINYLKKSNFDVFHPTYYDPYFLKYIKNKPFILTVHDMIHELFQEYFLKDKKTIVNKKKLLLTADKIIAISENTKKDIIKIFPEVKNKIAVIYHGFTFQQIKEDIPKEKFILFTGERTVYKNFINFLQAVAPILVKYNYNLFCTGKPFNINEEILINNLQIKDKVICILASENKLLELYSKATAFIFPSMYEGFGIPVLEAFAANCPTILSNTGSLPEVGADAAVYFDPYNIEDMRNKIEQVITTKTLQNELIKKGKKRVKYFSWEKCAKETMEVYKSL